VCILSVCVCLRFVHRIHHVLFILVPRHKSCESVKIGPPPRGHPLSYGISSFWLPLIYSRVVISTIISKIKKIAPNCLEFWSLDLLSFVWFWSKDSVSQVLIYLPLRSLSLILPISSGFEDFCAQFPPPKTNYSRQFPIRLKPVCAANSQSVQVSQKTPNWLKPVYTPAKASHRLKRVHTPAKAGLDWYTQNFSFFDSLFSCGDLVLWEWLS
jgi:hypothetical protein